METAVKAIILEDGKFLVLEQIADGKVRHSLPGGRVQSENYEEELMREVLEETGLIVNITKYIGDWFFIRERNGMKTICKTFVCGIVGGDLDSQRKEAYEDIKKYHWLTKEEFLDGNYTNDESLIQLIKDWHE